MHLNDIPDFIRITSLHNYYIFIREIRLPRFDDGKESIMNVENHVLHNSKLWFSARSVQILFAFKIFWCILGILWFIFQMQPCDCKYIYLYLFNILTMWVILIYGVYLRMIRCYEEKMSDFRLQTEESESSSDFYKDYKNTRERIRLLQLESERHLMIF